MAAPANRQWKLVARPVGPVKRSDFEWVTSPAASPAPGQVLVRVLYVSLDPAMRGWMADRRSYIPPVALGDVMRAIGVGQVVESSDPALAPGDHVTGLTGLQDYALMAAKDLVRIDPRLAPLPRFLGALGGSGMTAYFGLLDVGQARAGETVVVSAAAGSVGSLVGQIARIQGCRAIGIAGGPEKCAYVRDELGFDGVVDYKRGDVAAGLKEHCPKGIDVYFDNVGGEILDHALARLNRKARVVICGAISQYDNRDDASGPKNYLSLLVNRARMEGFIVFDYAARYAEAARALAGWMAEGKLKTSEQVEDGLENFPEVFLKLFRGENTGKLVLKVD
ncbi:MAG TPA: NADP-dependent oxidoreductase [Vicinamibacteria bacterium]|nr:NADP-dependent oxidoreductase [Vicinamibacteria bacterium]